MYFCVRGIQFASFHDFTIGYRNVPTVCYTLFFIFLLIIEILQFLSKVIFFHIKNKILLSLA